MATITQQPTTNAKEFLNREEIRTMQKDLRALREIDALSEKEKIVKINKAEEERVKQEILEKEKREAEERTRRNQILQKQEEEEYMASIQIKEYANEAEKQQIFLSEAKRLDLDNQLQIINKSKDPRLLLEKNQLLADGKGWQSKIGALAQDEQKLESEVKVIEEREKTTNIPQERQSLERGRQDLEGQREKIEKKRWSMEQEMKKINDRVAILDRDYKNLTEEKNQLGKKISDIDASLRKIYSTIVERETNKRKGLIEEQRLAQIKRAQALSQQKEMIQRKEYSTPLGAKEREYMKGIPLNAQEKLLQTTQTEEEQRRKFLQDVEQWAAKKDENKNNQPSNTNNSTNNNGQKTN